jgi:hypothetical protein
MHLIGPPAIRRRAAATGNGWVAIELHQIDIGCVGEQINLPLVGFVIVTG